MRGRTGRLGGVILFLFLLLVVTAAHANADPVAITSGTVVHDPLDGGSFALFGTDFAAVGGGVQNGFIFTFSAGFQGFEEPLSLSSIGGGFVASGGTVFSTMSPTAITGTLMVAAGPFSIPAPVAGQTSYSFSAPFTVLGSLETTAGASFALSGGGTASIAGPVVGTNGLLSYGSSRSELFTFSGSEPSPTPEPPPLFLLGIGLLGVGVRGFKLRPTLDTSR